MKTGIHPQFNDSIKVNCTGCGTAFQAGSTKPSISVHVCAKCHPFYTGEQRFLDTKGKVDKFQKKMAQSVTYKQEQQNKKAKKAEKENREVKSLRDLLGSI